MCKGEGAWPHGLGYGPEAGSTVAAAAAAARSRGTSVLVGVDRRTACCEIRLQRRVFFEGECLAKCPGSMAPVGGNRVTAAAAVLRKPKTEHNKGFGCQFDGTTYWLQLMPDTLHCNLLSFQLASSFTHKESSDACLPDSPAGSILHRLLVVNWTDQDGLKPTGGAQDCWLMLKQLVT